VGAEDQLQARLAAHIAARRKKAAADFKSVPVERPAPAFGATLLDGSGNIRFVHVGSLDDFVAVIEKELAIISSTKGSDQVTEGA
jgi:catalase